MNAFTPKRFCSLFLSQRTGLKEENYNKNKEAALLNPPPSITNNESIIGTASQRI